MAYKFPEIGFDFQILVDRAVKQMDLAYAPYSNYHVGCAVLSDDGESVFVGSNIENSAYPVGVCAEKSAIAYAASCGHRRFRAMVVATKDGGTCCGSCRQFCREFFPPATPIIFVNGKGEVVLESSMEGILPHSFGPENLGKTSQ